MKIRKLFFGAVGGFLNEPGRNSGQNSVTPKAAINWIILDDQFKFVTGNFSPVTAAYAGLLEDHKNDSRIGNIAVPKNGYLYVYVMSYITTALQ